MNAIFHTHRDENRPLKTLAEPPTPETNKKKHIDRLNKVKKEKDINGLRTLKGACLSAGVGLGSYRISDQFETFWRNEDCFEKLDNEYLTECILMGVNPYNLMMHSYNNNPKNIDYRSSIELENVSERDIIHDALFLLNKNGITMRKIAVAFQIHPIKLRMLVNEHEKRQS